MRRLLYINFLVFFILSITGIRIYGISDLLTNCEFYYTFNETTGVLDNVTGIPNSDGTVSVGVTRGEVGKVGNCYYFDSNSDYITFPYTNNHYSFSVSFWIKITSVTDDLIVLGSNAYYSRIFVGQSNNMKLETLTNGQEFASYLAFSYNQWYHIVIVKNGDDCTFYRDGSYVNTVNITGSNSFSWNSIGFNGDHSFRGYIDELGIWPNQALTAALVDTLYNGPDGIGAEGYPYPFSYTPEEPEEPPTTLHKMTLLNGKPRKTLLANIIRYKASSPEPEEPEDTIVYLFAENFETLPDLTLNTILTYWKPWTSYWYAASQSIIDIDGDRNKVWQSIYHQNREAQADGTEVFIPFNDTIQEIWFERKMKVDENWTGYSTLCYYSGKILNGVYGGRNPLYNGTFDMDDPDEYADWLDSTAYGNGWSMDGEWGSASGGCYSGNPNAMWWYWGDQTGFYYSLKPAGLVAPRDEWITLTQRVKLNSRGNADGIMESYIDGVLTNQLTNVLYRSVEQYDAGTNKVDGAMIRYMFGGGAGPEYICPRNDTLWLDDFVAYYYNESADNYLSGAAPVGHTIPTVGQAVDGLTNVYPTSSFSNENFFAPIGTIQSHYSGNFFVPQAASSSEIYTKTITDHSYGIHLTFSFYHNGWNNSGADESWIKVWSGVGAGKSLVYWWQETYEENGEPVVGTTYYITNTDCTIEYYPGRDWNAGFKLSYY